MFYPNLRWNLDTKDTFFLEIELALEIDILLRKELTPKVEMGILLSSKTRKNEAVALVKRYHPQGYKDSNEWQDLLWMSRWCVKTNDFSWIWILWDFEGLMLVSAITFLNGNGNEL